MKHILILAMAMLMALNAIADDPKLKGTAIGSDCWDYSTGSVVANGKQRAFDGNGNTYFATKDSERSYGWVGLDLGQKYVITKVGWQPRNDATVGAGRVLFAVFQGANKADFTDAIPIYMITEKGTLGVMDHADVDCSRGFRYVRYVGPSAARCNIGEIEFYGHPGAGDDSHLWQPTNLPTVCINTLNSKEPFDKETDIAGSVVILNNNKIDTDKSMTVRERGNASRGFPKKPWRIKFDKKTKVLGSAAEGKKWSLVNNYGDKSLMRNIVAFEIARRVGMAYVPFCKPVDVFLNGEFKGCYQLCDKIDIRPARVDITEMTAVDTSGDALTGGYLFEIDSYASGTDFQWFTSSKGVPITLHEPELNLYQQYRYITTYFNAFETKLFSPLFTSPSSGYRTVFDIESFLQHFIVNELSGNPDIYWSTYMYKQRQDPLIYTGPVWDFDLAFDNDNRSYPMNNMKTFLYQGSNILFAGKMKDLANRIIVDDRNTRNDLSQMWSRLRNGGKINAESLRKFIDDTADKIRPSAELNFRRWPILTSYVHLNPRVPNTYNDEITFIKNFLSERITKLDGSSFMKLDPTVSALDEVMADAASGIHVEGRVITVDGDTPFRVVTTSGMTVHNGTGATRELQPGVYIVSRGASPAVRILVR